MRSHGVKAAALLCAAIGIAVAQPHASAQAPVTPTYNPNPKSTVYYGDQTWEEMHFPSDGIVVDDIRLTHRDVVAPGGYVGGASLLGGAP